MGNKRLATNSPFVDDAFQSPTVELRELIVEPVMSDSDYYNVSEMGDAAAFDVEADLKAHHRIPNIIIGITLLAIIVGGFVLLYFGGLKLLATTKSPEDYPGPGGAEIIVTIPAGADLGHIAQLLFDKDITASTEAFKKEAVSHPSYFADIQAADYRLRIKMRAEDALRILGDPSNVIQAYFTIPEGFRNTQVFERIHALTGVLVSELVAVADNPIDLELPEWANGVVEGYLSPNTYAYDATPSALEALQPMVAEFKRVTAEIDFVAAAQALGITPADAVIMAGLVEKEGGSLQYAADIAGVFYNRLRIGMALQSDATVLYALDNSGTLDVTDEMTSFDSPYNTYLYTGLPPTAISNPGRISLLAAVHPSVHEYLYFVATNPSIGEVKFARNWEEHLSNVAEFNAWCAANPTECGTG
ncbi:MAG: endolytic transglycosylase MltG [Propionibacteriaceae bacterium]|nr:endolytic transglycosylase MltG [Propionibacteriaceae bacterium]